ncbi:MAG: DUF885 domain-containing protein [Gemmatimonadaceae bacterium]|nr:DUF885 domain-containing protein [Gemmatimonadaceae bacterium]
MTDRAVRRVRLLTRAVAPSLATLALATQVLSGQASCRDDEWHVSPLSGPHLQIAGQLGATPSDAAAAARSLQSMRGVPQRLAAHRARLEVGRVDGFTASRDNVLRVLDQLEVLDAELDPSATPAPLTSVEGPVGDSLRQSVRGEVRTALREYAAYLRETYIGSARENGGLASLPGGATCYRERVLQISGLDTPPESLAALAARKVAALDAELAPVAARLVGPMPLADAKRVLRRDPQFLFTSREEMLESARALERALTPAVARLFHNPPSAPLLIEPTPAVRERSDPPARYGAPRGPGEPGTFYLNTWQPDSQPRWNLPVAVSHEGAPGHHFERTYPRSVELPASARSRGIGAYIEGWGMYAEEIAARESGALEDDLSRAGFLLHFLDAWNALELDARIHLDGWTREEVIAQTMHVTGKSRTVAALYADRHTAAPGQLASYMTGYNAIRSMRDEAERELGSRFDVRDFHERVLEAGPLPLSTVQERVRAWISATRAAGPGPA